MDDAVKYPFRIRGDFNADGIEDVAVLSDISSLNECGGTFVMHLKDKNGHYRPYSRFFFNPKAIAVEKYGSTANFWVYQATPYGFGRIGYYEMNKDDPSEFHRIEIHPCEDGTIIGQAIYDAVFKNSDVQFVFEVSEIVDNLTRWRKIEEHSRYIIHENFIKNYLKSLYPDYQGKTLPGITVSRDAGPYLEDYTFLGKAMGCGEGVNIYLLESDRRQIAFIWVDEGGDHFQLPYCEEKPISYQRTSKDITKEIQPGDGIVIFHCPQQSWLDSVHVSPGESDAQE
ncbi:hypothetical protein JXQ70_10220 [bacterium]|nr:hypothetical protein [bacterium]